MTTPASLQFLFRFQLMLFQLLPAIGNADLPGQGLQPFELLPADELRDGQVDGLGFRLRPGNIHQLLDQAVIKAHGGAHWIPPSVVRPTLLYTHSGAVIPAKAGIQLNKTGFRVKPGMTIKVKGLSTHYTSLDFHICLPAMMVKAFE